MSSRTVCRVAVLAALSLAAATPGARAADTRRPDILIITVDTLRADRLSSYGYTRPTTPNIDHLLADGARFDTARTVEPLTTPSMATMLTSLYPHEHGATRNGLRVLPGLVSLPGILHGFGYRTAAFVGNWTLRRKLSGLDEHFETYAEVFTRKRWFGLVSSEATAEDLTSRALAWADEYTAKTPREPFLLWVHYVDPHAPYLFHPEFAEALGIPRGSNVPPGDRYDTEIALSDHAIGELIAGLAAVAPRDNTLVIFAADHGESLGEHGTWGHGRQLYDQTLRIPMGIVWPGLVPPGVIEAPASMLDIAPTALGLMGLPSPRKFHGYDWSGVILDGVMPPDRVLYFQAHKGAVMSRHASARARRKGLLELGRLEHGRKEMLRMADGRHSLFDLDHDAAESRNLADPASPPSPDLRAWVDRVVKALQALDTTTVEPMDEETAKKLRSLGYIH